METSIKQRLHEELTKTDVKNEVKLQMDSNDFEKKIIKIVKDFVKNDKAMEDKVIDISKNVLIQLYKTLWIKRSFWANNLTNKGT